MTAVWRRKFSRKFVSRVAVIAVGGNALITSNQHRGFADQYEAIRGTATHIADLIQQGWTVVVTHGNGPQVGWVLQRSELSRHLVNTIPMDCAVASTQGTIGYQFQQILANILRERGLQRPTATLITQVEVDPDDPAFEHPTKPIGSFMDEATARQRADQDGWNVVEDSGRGWRRVVPSPKPQRIVEEDVILRMVEAGICVIGVGGGGVPVVRRGENLEGVPAVIDKDLASSLLARTLNAELFLISTAVESVFLHYGTPQQRQLGRVSLAEARHYLSEGHFKAGSMKPKVEAAIAYVEATGGRALITNPENMTRAVAGETGTHIEPDPAPTITSKAS